MTRARSAVLVAAVLLTACSSTSVDTVAGPQDASDAWTDSPVQEAGKDTHNESQVCNVTSCASISADCGQMPDGCGGVLDCGTCPDKKYCGGAGPNRCGDKPCTPITCASKGYDCGEITDGCSKIISCGQCSGYESCAGSGHPNKCGCTPTGCGGIECGDVDNGCGGVASCGTCVQGVEVCLENTCCAAAVNTACTKTCYEVQGPVLGYSQYEAVWCSGEGQSKLDITNCSEPDPDPCTTHGDPPNCGLEPGYKWCTVRCNHYFDCPGTVQCDGSCG
ncbi:MAG: hypothetical protein HY898_33040 [Deltaproteobacteria bacterium]|nr:hypothetical protein [Deltaproteobacteria bacterium]